MHDAKTNSQQHIILGYAGLVCLNSLQYRALGADNVLFFGGLSFVVALMWSLIYKLMAPAVKVTAVTQLFIVCAYLLLSAVFFIAAPYLASESAMRICLFIVVNVAFVLGLHRFCNQNQLTSE
jgi:hypothetical protein